VPVDPWGWWLVAAGLLVIGEILTLDLTFAMLAAGAAAAAGAAGLDAADVLPVNVVAQSAVGLVVALLGIVFLRPAVARHAARTTPSARTGVARLIGAQAVVLEPVGPRGGQVKLDGEVWSARSYDGASEYEAGADVSVVQIDGATALVG
jgi:membrane protein implicated in regulation of membrane protease activity